MGGLGGVAQAAVVSSWTLANDASNSVDGNTGTAQDVVFTGSEAVFNGTTSRITVPYNPNLSRGTADVTASVQVNTTYMPGTGSLDFDLIRSSPTGKMYKVELFPHGGKAQAQCIFHGSLNGTATRITIKGTRKMNDGNWHTITCQKTATKVTLTTDNIVENSQTIQIGTIHLGKGKMFAIGYKPNTTAGGADHYIGAMKNLSVAIG